MIAAGKSVDKFNKIIQDTGKNMQNRDKEINQHLDSHPSSQIRLHPPRV